MNDVSNNENIMVKDVVCGMVKTKNEMGAQSEYKGKTYYFCWEGDKQMFEANPDHWITKSDASLQN